MNKKLVNKIKLLITVVIISLFVWFLIISPNMTFRTNEKDFESAARRYFELNSDELPTGERIKTLSLETLFHKSYIKNDYRAPYSGKSCSVQNSWVKVKKENGDYIYYTYLDCGFFKSKVDHEGPVIKLNGNEEITIGFDEEYKEPGISSVVDANDGKLNTEDVIIKGSVDTSEVGTYELTYTAFDKLKNKTVVKRTIKVVKKLSSIVKKDLGKSQNYVGNPENNYINFSNILFRIYGLDSDNNIIIATKDPISYVSYSKLNDWLDYFYDNLTDEAKKYVVETKFCNMKMDNSTLDTTQCNSYTSKRKLYVPSIIDINRSSDINYVSFLKTDLVTLTANSSTDGKVYTNTPEYLTGSVKTIYTPNPTNYNYAVMPMLVLNKSILISDGDGSSSDPYILSDAVVRATGGSSLNTRYVGEYFIDNDILWRIIAIDGENVKAISYSALGRSDTLLRNESDTYIYNPYEKYNYGYLINNMASDYINGDIFVAHEFDVPIYKKLPIFKGEVETAKYKVKFAPPNMFEMFSTFKSGLFPYWFINSSKDEYIASAANEGIITNEKSLLYSSFGFRVVGYVNSKVVISSGAGTEVSPYKIK